MSRGTSDRLADILAAIGNATAADRRSAQADAGGDDVGVQMAFDAILHNLFVIGEAVKSIPASELSSEPAIPWSEIAGMREVIGHHYHRVVPAIIHASVSESLAPLADAVRRIQAAPGAAPP